MGTLLVTVALLHHLYALLSPYQVQEAHEAWLEKTCMKMENELAHRWEIVAKRDDDGTQLEDRTMNDLEAEERRISSLIKVMLKMKEEMSANRAAPKLLGLLELNETLIDSIIASISTALTSLVLCFFIGLMTELGENSGIYPTSEPTSAP